MKCKNTLKKIIHSVCLISVLFLSVFFVLPPVEVYAASYTVKLHSQAQNTNTYSLYACHYDGTVAYLVETGSISQGHYKSFNLDGNYLYRVSCGRHQITYNNSALSTRPSSATHITSYNLYINDTLYANEVNFYFYIEDSAIATPTPDPTPTPTPVPSPTPLENAEAFFGKLGDDAQNGVGAILTAWNAASSHFYTGVLFIVLPVFLGIVSLIASFFFGGGDDD